MSERKTMQKPCKYASVAKSVDKSVRNGAVMPDRGHPIRGGDATPNKEGGAKIKSIEGMTRRCSEEVWDRICAEFNEMEDKFFQKKRRHG